MTNLRDFGVADISELAVHGPVQERVQGLYQKISTRMHGELGIDLERHNRRLLVIENKGASPLADIDNMSTLADGSIVVNRKYVELSDEIGQVVAGSRTPNELMDNMLALAKGAPRRLGPVDTSRVDHYRDSALAFSVAHEATHSAKDHAIAQKPASFSSIKDDTTAALAKARYQRVKETVADAGGADLAMRAGFSPLAVLASTMHGAFSDALDGYFDNTDTHPVGVKRYEFVYNYIDKRKNEARRIYNGEDPSHTGKEFMSPQQIADFERLPTPAQVRAVVESLRKPPSPQ